MNKLQEKTKSIDTIVVDGDLLSCLISEKRSDKILELIKIWYSERESFIRKAIDDYEWIHFENCGLYFVPAEYMLIVDPMIIELEKHELVDVKEFGADAGAMSLKSAVQLFSVHKDKNPLLNERGRIEVKIDGGKQESEWLFVKEKGRSSFNILETDRWADYGMYDFGVIKLPVYYLNREEKKDIMSFLIKRDFKLPLAQEEARFIREICSELVKEKVILKGRDKLNVWPERWLKKKHWCLEKFEKEEKLFGDILNNEQIKKDMGCWPIGKEAYNFVCEELSKCDEKRIHMEKYPLHRIEDPESGHWDLWERKKDGVTVKLPETKKLVARNPVWDALYNRSSIVGIDFGTKSTVVTYRKNRPEIMPMRIGSGQYAREASSLDYENPTVMEFRDIEKFCEAYKKKAGRPETCWDDLLISHEAFEQLKSEQSKGETFATFFSELKQWSSDKERQVTIKDSHGKEIDLKPYLELGDGDFDPIEIYAYYIGMFINNMNHGIFLRYKLSFPAKAEKKVREKVLSSFERGIKKSLPQPVLDSEECRKYLKIEQGVSEPAAYAICALKEYGFNEIDIDEKVYYGIFDFGGGTTDFDFGVWSIENDEKYEDNYDYRISRFGKGEDPYLGGENLLADLAYDVFNVNYQNLLGKEIIFTRPYGAKEEVGKDWLVKQDSQYARFNSKRLMEKLRGVWENDLSVREEMKSGSIQVNLFNQKGENIQNFTLNVKLEELDKSIEEHVERGVTQFFSTLKNSFRNNLSEICKMGEMNIFLAGNSSKSPVVTKVLKKHIEKLYSDMSEAGDDVADWIKVFPPLGTSQADKIQAGKLKPSIADIIEDQEKEIAKEREKISKSSELIQKDGTTNAKEDGFLQNVEESSNLLERIKKPNGKTGVAFGLLDSKVRIEQDESEENSFTYYIGQNRRGKFKCVIDKDQQEYNEWVRFCAATVEEFDIYFTRSSEAASNNLSINDRGTYYENGYVDEIDDEKSVYIRLVSPTEIEYTVAGEREVKDNKVEQSKIIRVLLQEKA